jgi:hypothetical protein
MFFVLSSQPVTSAVAEGCLRSALDADAILEDEGLELEFRAPGGPFGAVDPPPLDEWGRDDRE